MPRSRSLEAELAELERTDPAVKDAAEALDRAVEHVLRGVSVVRFRKSTPTRPIRVVRGS